MKSIKPGRGPSFMGGILSIAVGIFGIIWTIVAVNIGGGFVALFGIIFVFVAIVSAVYNFKNATGKNRYSAFDLTDGEEEPDPLNLRFGARPDANPRSSGSAFCPYCGTKVEGEYAYCNKCGKKLP